MARNRKSQSAALRFGPALKAFLFCLLIGGAGLGYVWQKDQIGRLGKQKKSCEKQLALLEDQNEKLKTQLAILRSPKALEARILDLKLGLVRPLPTQIWWLNEAATELRGPGRAGQFAAENHRAPGTP